MKLTIEEAENMMQENDGSLYLSGCTGLTSLPENLTCNGSLDLSGCTGLTSLPENLTCNGYLDLSGCTGLTSLPENLTCNGSLYLRGCTGLTSLPENLTCNGSLSLSGCTGIADHYNARRNVKILHDGDYVPGRFIYCDGILTHIKKEKSINGYTLYIGKIKGKNVVSDGKNYAHCDKLRDGIADLLFKSAKDRGADQFRDLTLDSVLTVQEAATMYRIITGACRQGTQAFIDSFGDNLKEKYSIRELLKETKGQYGYSAFAEYFGYSE